MIKRLVLILLAMLITVSICSCNTAVHEETASPDITETSTIAAAVSPSAQPTAGENKALAAAEYTAAPSAAPSPSPSAVETPGSGKAVIIFTFDDGPASDYLLAYPILKEYGIKGTSYIITKFVDNETKGKLSWEQIKEMADYGWVFGGHTYKHQRLARMTDEEIKQDCEYVRWSFLNRGLKSPEIMAYPYGSYNKRVIEAIKPYYKQARLAYYRTDFVDTNDPNPYAVECISADMRTKSALKKAEKLVDKACKQGSIIVFRVHTLYRDKPYDTVKRNTHIASGCAPQTDTKLFAELVKYCTDKGCAFMTMTELMDYMDGE